ncbi:hypothetical protein V6N13_098506 [Hibiscus sabdariffa]
MKSTSCWSVLNILLAILILFSSPRFCFARDNITVKTRLADGETLVSAGNRFELEFFGPSTTSSVKRCGDMMDADFLLISWSREEDPSLGNFTFKQDPEGQLVVMEKSTIHWRSSRLDSNQIIKSDELPSTVVKFFNFNQSETRFY